MVAEYGQAGNCLPADGGSWEAGLAGKTGGGEPVRNRCVCCAEGKTPNKPDRKVRQMRKVLLQAVVLLVIGSLVGLAVGGTVLKPQPASAQVQPQFGQGQPPQNPRQPGLGAGQAGAAGQRLRAGMALLGQGTIAAGPTGVYVLRLGTVYRLNPDTLEVMAQNQLPPPQLPGAGAGGGGGRLRQRQGLGGGGVQPPPPPSQ